MKKALSVLGDNFNTIRTGRANPAILDRIMVRQTGYTQTHTLVIHTGNTYTHTYTHTNALSKYHCTARTDAALQN